MIVETLTRQKINYNQTWFTCRMDYFLLERAPIFQVITLSASVITTKLNITEPYL